MSHIFISYSHKDKAYAHKLHQHLFEHGLDAWIDDRIDYGSRWPHEIEKRIKDCSVFILIMSPDSYESEWVQNELSLARELQKPIYPLLLEGNVWWHLRTTQYVNVTDGELPPTKFFVSLTEILKSQEDYPHISIHVGGNVDGNIVVGNNNDVQSSMSKAQEAEQGKAERERVADEAKKKAKREQAKREVAEKAAQEQVELKAAEKITPKPLNKVPVRRGSGGAHPFTAAQKSISPESQLPKPNIPKESPQKRGWRLFNAAIILFGFFAPWAEGRYIGVVNGFGLAFTETANSYLLRQSSQLSIEYFGASILFLGGSISIFLYCVINVFMGFHIHDWMSKPIWMIFVSALLASEILGISAFVLVFGTVNGTFLIFSESSGSPRSSLASIHWGFWLTWIGLISSSLFEITSYIRRKA